MNAVELSAQAQHWIGLLADARRAEKDAKETGALAKRNILALLGEADEGRLDDEPIVRRHVTVRRTVDTDMLRDLFPEVYEKCLRTASVESVRLVGER